VERPEPIELPEDVNRPLLKSSIIALSVGFAIAFLAGVASSNAPPNSRLEIVGSMVNRLGVFVMLVAFCLILLAYRIRHIRKLTFRVSNQRWFESGYAALVVFNLFLIGGIWCLVYVTSAWPGPGNVLLAFGFGIVYIALMVTMVIWHTGYLRAYAVGALTASCIIVYSGAPTVWAVGPAFRRGASSFPLWSFGTIATFVVVSGTLCAGYVYLLLHAGLRRENKTADSTDR
jgi:hypothetical protein